MGLENFFTLSTGRWRSATSYQVQDGDLLMGTAVPLNQAKAELFRTLGHPTRIRVLELLVDGPRAVHELLADIKVESSNLSQQLAVLRRAGLVTSTRERSTVVYTLATPDITELLRYGRQILATVLRHQDQLLDQLYEDPA
jgi:ArsR family transcriptional regulator